MRINLAMKKQMEADINACDNQVEAFGSKRLYDELIARYSTLDSAFTNGLPKYAKFVGANTDLDYRPELKAVSAKLKTYLLMDETEDTGRTTLRDIIDEFIQRGERIGKDEYHPAEKGLGFSYIGGPQYDMWMSEINTFNERNLKSHPLYRSIQNAYFHRKTKLSSYDDMMGHLRALAADDVFWRIIVPNENTKLDTFNIDIKARKTTMLYDVFISHANVDKIDYVDELKHSFDKLGVSVFYDKDTLEWGDRWKDKIMEGVKQAEFAIIVISENFFGREWTEKELNEFLNRQNSSGQKIILPILHNITFTQLKEKYPAVADIQALNSDDYSCDEIALKYASLLIKRLKS